MTSEHDKQFEATRMPAQQIHLTPDLPDDVHEHEVDKLPDAGLPVCLECRQPLAAGENWHHDACAPQALSKMERDEREAQYEQVLGAYDAQRREIERQQIKIDQLEAALREIVGLAFQRNATVEDLKSVLRWVARTAQLKVERLAYYRPCHELHLTYVGGEYISPVLDADVRLAELLEQVLQP